MDYETRRRMACAYEVEVELHRACAAIVELGTQLQLWGADECELEQHVGAIGSYLDRARGYLNRTLPPPTRRGRK